MASVRHLKSVWSHSLKYRSVSLNSLSLPPWPLVPACPASGPHQPHSAPRCLATQPGAVEWVPRTAEPDDSWPSRLGLWISSVAVSVVSILFIAKYKPGRELQAAEPIPPPHAQGLQPPETPQRKRSRRESYNFIADVVQEVAASLVYIEIKDMGVRDYYTGTPVTSSNGSGFVVQSDGLILTNAHVVINKPRSSVHVRLQDGRTFIGVIEAVDIQSDLATVRIPCKNLPVMPLGTSSNVRPGEFVIAMGSPLSLSNTITTGVVSASSRARAELGLRDRDVPDYIQTDAAITFGNSGGPLVNLDGEAIGINSMKVTPGISFAIPIDYAKEFLKKSERGSNKVKPRGERRYTGITFLTINSQIIDDLRLRMEIPLQVRHGIAIFRIVVGSPAHRAGLLPGDVVTQINGKPILTSKDFYNFLESDEDLEMTVCRKSKMVKFRVTPDPYDVNAGH
eukprot:maker-scaffold61_size441589-snap-gene-3.34 protein:Tk06318 transcript:maker-scaffold61_size441589-snap-gene-3.34-mRNA-1 annotation:"serine protease mitochondrial"